jgi:hypothetical protein
MDEYARRDDTRWPNAFAYHRGRDAHCWAPPAQIPAGAIRAPGSYLG